MVPKYFLEQHDPDRKEFQIDRIILFSDAVFAIAITLLIIEIKAPEIAHGTSTDRQIQDLINLIPKFVAFAISFFVIAIYWRSHHRLFGFVTQYSNRLIWFNIYFLFTIVLMPFSAAYYSENFGYVIPYNFYNVNIILTGFINYFFIRHVFNPKHQLVKHMPSPAFIHLFKARAIAIPIFFAGLIVITMFGFVPGPYIFALLWPMFVLLRKYNFKKYSDMPEKVHHKH